MRFLADRRFVVVSAVSIIATIAGCTALVMIAKVHGLDPLGLTGDSKGYVLLAQNILEHGVFSVTDDPFEPESFRAPGYPAFLAVVFALFGVSIMALFVHALVASTAPIFLYLLTRTFHERAAFWGAIVFALEPVRLFLSASFLSDALFAVLFLAMLALTAAVKDGSVGRAIGVGALLGACILVRPIAIFLPLVVAAYLIVDHRFSKRGFLAGLLVGLSALAIIFPWMYRNHEVFNSWNIASVGSANLVLYNAPEFLKWRPNPQGEAMLATFRAEQETLPRHEALSLARSEVLTKTFRTIIRDHEVSYVTFHIIKTIPFFVTDGLRDTMRVLGFEVGSMPNVSTTLMRGDVGAVLGYLRSGGLAIGLFVIGVGWWGIVSVLMTVAAVGALWRRDIQILFLIALIAYFALLTGPVSNARYRVPVEGLMLFAAAYVVVRWWDVWYERT